MQFGIGSYVIYEVFLNHDMTRFSVKDKLLLRCVDDILRRGAFLFFGWYYCCISNFDDEIFKEERM